MKGKAILAALALAAAAGMNADAQTLARDGVEVSPEVYSFGEQDALVEMLSGQFVLRNTGKDELRLEDVVPGCHCTKVEWSREPVAPGDSCVIAFVYHKDMVTKSFRKDIKVMTNRSDEPLTLKISGVFVESEESMAQKYPYAHGVLGLESEVVTLGNVYKGDTTTEIIKVANRSTEMVRLAVGECSEGVSANMVKETVLPLDEGFLRVQVEAGENWGWNEYSVTPTVDGKAVEPIRVRALTVPDFRDADRKTKDEGPYPLFQRSTVKLEVESGKPQGTAWLGLENLGKGTLEVLSAQIPDGHFKVDCPGRVAANQNTVLKISLDASGLAPGKYITKMYMVSNSPEAPVSKVDVVYVVK